MPRGDENERGLNAGQQAFCHAYVATHNATKAAVKAGYSPKTADVQGCKLLALPKIKLEVARLEANVLDELGLTAYFVAKRLKDIAKDGSNRDAISALTLLAKWRGLWAERIEVSGDVVFTMDIPRPRIETDVTTEAEPENS